MAQATQENDLKSVEANSSKHLTFKLAGEEYGIEILKVQEIIKMQEITAVPRTPDFMSGVINLRGKVIPVVDLRSKFGLPGKEATEHTCIIVVQVGSGSSLVTTGVTVDQVSEVMDIDGNQIEPAPEFGAQTDTEYIMGIAKTEGGVKILLDIDRVLSVDEMRALKMAG